MILTSIKVFLFLSVVTGVFYPLVMTMIAPPLGDNPMLERLSGLHETEPQFFWSRSTGPTNQGRLHPDLSKVYQDRKDQGRVLDQIQGSASGLDPEISPDSAYAQIPRILKHRTSIQESELKKLVEDATESPQWGYLGEYRVSVARLNRCLERAGTSEYDRYCSKKPR